MSTGGPNTGDREVTTAELNRILDGAPIGVAVVGPDGKFRQANRAYLEITGLTALELAGRDWQSVTHPGDFREQIKLMATVNGGIGSADFVKRYITKAGRSVWCRTTIHGMDSGDFVKYVVPEPVSEPLTLETWPRKAARLFMDNWKTAAMLIVTALGSIWAQYQSFVGRIENAEEQAVAARRDIETMRPLLLQIKGGVEFKHPDLAPIK